MESWVWPRGKSKDLVQGHTMSFGSNSNEIYCSFDSCHKIIF